MGTSVGDLALRWVLTWGDFRALAGSTPGVSSMEGTLEASSGVYQVCTTEWNSEQQEDVPQ